MARIPKHWRLTRIEKAMTRDALNYRPYDPERYSGEEIDRLRQEERLSIQSAIFRRHREIEKKAKGVAA